MRNAFFLLAAAVGASLQAATFHDAAVKRVAASDFAGLKVIAAKRLADPGLPAKLKAGGDVREAVDWAMLIDRTGPAELKDFAESGGHAFLAWIAANPDALEEYVHGGADGEVGIPSLRVWQKLWIVSEETRKPGIWRRFAIASALVQSLPVHAMADGSAIDARRRLAFYQKSQAEGALSPYFEKAAVWELRYVAGSWALDTDLAWVRGAMKPELKNQAKVGDACWMVPYRDKNAKGVSVQEGGKFYDGKPMTLQLMTEYGGVCGAIGRFGTSAAQAIGVPAMPVGQPGHCAFLWRNSDTTWAIGEDIFGWGGSGQHDGIRVVWGAVPAYVPLYDKARRDEQAFVLADRLAFAAAVSEKKEPLLRAATTACPLFLPAWRQWVALERNRFPQAAKALAVSPYAIRELTPYDGEQYQVALGEIAKGDAKEQLGTQTWAVLDIMAHKLQAATQKTFGVQAVLECKQPHFAWDGTDDTSQAIVKAALKAVEARGDLTAQLQKLLKG